MTWHKFRKLSASQRIKEIAWTRENKLQRRILETVEHYRKWIQREGIRLERMAEVAVERKHGKPIGEQAKAALALAGRRVEDREIDRLIQYLFQLSVHRAWIWARARVPGPTAEEDQPATLGEHFVDLLRKYASLVFGWQDRSKRTFHPGLGAVIWGSGTLDMIDFCLMTSELSTFKTEVELATAINELLPPGTDCLDQIQKRIAAIGPASA